MTTPEHLHLALNHIPFLGAGFALIPLAFGWFTRQRGTIFAGLAIAALSGWVTPLVMATGEAAYERYKHGPIAAYLVPDAESVLEAHEERAEAFSKVMYANAAISTLCLVLLYKKAGWARLLAPVAGIFCVAALLAGIWVAESGGPIRRPDFRKEPSPNSGNHPATGHQEGDRERKGDEG